MLGVDSRVADALSRARFGLYIVGNASLLGAESALWESVLRLLKQERAACMCTARAQRVHSACAVRSTHAVGVGVRVCLAREAHARHMHQYMRGRHAPPAAAPRRTASSVTSCRSSPRAATRAATHSSARPTTSSTSPPTTSASSSKPPQTHQQQHPQRNERRVQRRRRRHEQVLSRASRALCQCDLSVLCPHSDLTHRTEQHCPVRTE